jgi:hypothetical protein
VYYFPGLQRYHSMTWVILYTIPLPSSRVLTDLVFDLIIMNVEQDVSKYCIIAVDFVYTQGNIKFTSVADNYYHDMAGRFQPSYYISFEMYKYMFNICIHLRRYYGSIIFFKIPFDSYCRNLFFAIIFNNSCKYRFSYNDIVPVCSGVARRGWQVITPPDMKCPSYFVRYTIILKHSYNVISCHHETIFTVSTN